MIGLVGVFTAGVPNQPEFIKTITLLVPQGWAMRGLTIALDGGTIQDLLPIFGGLMVWTAAFSLIGLRRMRTRYA
jgi:ABC-type multidrug transport system permease subunit